MFALARAGHALLQTFAVSKTSNLFWEWIPPFAALGFAFAPLLWSQATIPEVYALNLFFVAVMLWAVLSTHRHRVSIAALMFGLGAAHHLSVLFLVPGAWILLEPKKRDVRAFVWFFVPLLLYAYLPLAALANPPVNWGDPVTPARFFWLVSAEPYRAYWFDVGGAEIAGRTAFAARALTEQFTFVGVAFVLWGEC